MKDRWLKAAITDDNLVAELLIRLNQSSSSSFHPPPPKHLLQQLSWGNKQPRSTPMRKYSTNTRCSPRTPLSWSGGAATTSPSDGGYDDTSVSYAASEPLSASRSKNFLPIKKEESQLLKERVNLKRDSKTIHVNMKERSNVNLKKIKFDLNQQSAEGGALSTEPEVLFAKHCSRMGASTTNPHQPILSRLTIKKGSALENSSGMQEVAETNKRGFVVPDLNMPMGDDEIAAELW